MALCTTQKCYDNDDDDGDDDDVKHVCNILTFTTIFVQPWGETIFSRMFTFQT